MAVIVPKDVYVPPADLRAIEQEMADKPGNWRVFSAQPDTGIYTLMTPLNQNDPESPWLGYRVQLDTEPLFDLNHEEEVASQNQRFPDEVCVARIPEHLLYSNAAGNIGQAVAEADWKHVKKVLNDPDHKKFRSFRGRL